MTSRRQAEKSQKKKEQYEELERQRSRESSSSSEERESVPPAEPSSHAPSSTDSSSVAKPFRELSLSYRDSPPLIGTPHEGSSPTHPGPYSTHFLPQGGTLPTTAKPFSMHRLTPAVSSLTNPGIYSVRKQIKASPLSQAGPSTEAHLPQTESEAETGEPNTETQSSELEHEHTEPSAAHTPQFLPQSGSLLTTAKPFGIHRLTPGISYLTNTGILSPRKQVKETPLSQAGEPNTETQSSQVLEHEHAGPSAAPIPQGEEEDISYKGEFHESESQFAQASHTPTYQDPYPRSFWTYDETMSPLSHTSANISEITPDYDSPPLVNTYLQSKKGLGPPEESLDTAEMIPELNSLPLDSTEISTEYEDIEISYSGQPRPYLYRDDSTTPREEPINEPTSDMSPKLLSRSKSSPKSKSAKNPLPWMYPSSCIRPFLKTPLLSQLRPTEQHMSQLFSQPAGPRVDEPLSHAIPALRQGPPSGRPSLRQTQSSPQMRLITKTPLALRRSDPTQAYRKKDNSQGATSTSRQHGPTRASSQDDSGRLSLRQTQSSPQVRIATKTPLSLRRSDPTQAHRKKDYTQGAASTSRTHLPQKTSLRQHVPTRASSHEDPDRGNSEREKLTFSPGESSLQRKENTRGITSYQEKSEKVCKLPGEASVSQGDSPSQKTLLLQEKSGKTSTVPSEGFICQEESSSERTGHTKVTSLSQETSENTSTVSSEISITQAESYSKVIERTSKTKLSKDKSDKFSEEASKSSSPKQKLSAQKKSGKTSIAFISQRETCSKRTEYTRETMTSQEKSEKERKAPKEVPISQIDFPPQRKEHVSKIMHHRERLGKTSLEISTTSINQQESSSIRTEPIRETSSSQDVSGKESTAPVKVTISHEKLTSQQAEHTSEALSYQDKSDNTSTVTTIVPISQKLSSLQRQECSKTLLAQKKPAKTSVSPGDMSHFQGESSEKSEKTNADLKKVTSPKRIEHARGTLLTQEKSEKICEAPNEATPSKQTEHSRETLASQEKSGEIITPHSVLSIAQGESSSNEKTKKSRKPSKALSELSVSQGECSSKQKKHASETPVSQEVLKPEITELKSTEEAPLLPKRSRPCIIVHQSSKTIPAREDLFQGKYLPEPRKPTSESLFHNKSLQEPLRPAKDKSLSHSKSLPEVGLSGEILSLPQDRLCKTMSTEIKPLSQQTEGSLLFDDTPSLWSRESSLRTIGYTGTSDLSLSRADSLSHTQPASDATLAHVPSITTEPITTKEIQESQSSSTSELISETGLPTKQPAIPPSKKNLSQTQSLSEVTASGSSTGKQIERLPPLPLDPTSEMTTLSTDPSGMETLSHNIVTLPETCESGQLRKSNLTDEKSVSKEKFPLKSAGSNERQGKTPPKSAGSNEGQGKTPPESGGSNEGQGKTHPESAGSNEGQGKTPPERAGSNEGQGKTPSESAGSNEGQGKTPPESAGSNEGQGKTPPESAGSNEGQGKTPPDSAGSNEGQGKTPPESAGSNEGQGKTPSESAGSNEGQGKTPPESAGSNEGQGKTPPESAGSNEGQRETPPKCTGSSKKSPQSAGGSSKKPFSKSRRN